MAERVRRPSYIRAWIGVAICVYAVANFARHLDHPNYIGLTVFLVVGALLAVGGFMRRYTRRDWINDEFTRQLATDDALRRSNARARLSNTVGWALVLLAIAWTLYGANQFGSNRWDFTLEIAACIAAPGLVLMTYRSVITGAGEFRAIRRARERLSNEKSGTNSEQ